MLFGALGGYSLSARLGGISTRFGTELLMPAIAAPVMYGVSLKGGGYLAEQGEVG